MKIQFLLFPFSLFFVTGCIWLEFDDYPITSAIPPGIAPVRCFATAGPTSADTTPVVILIPSAPGYLCGYDGACYFDNRIACRWDSDCGIRARCDLTAIATPIARYNATPTVTGAGNYCETTTCATALDVGLTDCPRGTYCGIDGGCWVPQECFVGTTALKASSVPQMVVVT